MNFVFQGFQSDLPVWVYLLLIAGTTTLSWWTYRNIKAIAPLYRYLLIALRSLVFFILLLLLLNPFFKAETTYLEEPEVLVFLDNSSSTAIQKGDYEGIDTYREVLDRLNFEDSADVKYHFFSFDSKVQPAHIDSLRFNGSETNLYNIFEHLKDQAREADAAVLLTDGIFTEGRNPAFEAGNTSLPIYTVALGDTTRQKDLIVKNVTTNSTGYLNTEQPVAVTVLNNGFLGHSFKVQIQKEGKVLQSQTVTPGNNLSSHTLNFDLNFEKKGLQQFRVIIPDQEGEWSKKNNTQNFSVDVLDNKQQVLSLAFEVHPDVKWVRSVLLSDKNTSLTSRTWLGGQRFIEGSLNVDPDTLDLLILQGYPGNGLSSSLRQQVTSIIKNVPAVIMSTPQMDLRTLSRQTQVNLPIQLTSAVDEMDVNPKPAIDRMAHPIMELPDIDPGNLPTVYAPIQNVNLATGAKLLFESSYHNHDTNKPLVAVEEIGNVRRAQLSGYGWYRMAQNTDSRKREFADRLLLNIVSWTAEKPDNRKLKIQPSQKSFSNTEPIVLNAFLTNESGEKESGASIGVTISGDNIEDKYYSMENSGNGRYQLELNALPEGIYHFKATARKGNRTIESRNGEFSVDSSNLELVNTNRNDALLKQIAKRSGGHYFSYNALENFSEVLNKKGVLSKEEKLKETLLYPYQYSLWFILVVILLGAEWIIRKYFALP